MFLPVRGAATLKTAQPEPPAAANPEIFSKNRIILNSPTIRQRQAIRMLSAPALWPPLRLQARPAANPGLTRKIHR